MKSPLTGTAAAASANKSFRYMRRQPTIVQYDPEVLVAAAEDNNNSEGGGGGVGRGGGEVRFAADGRLDLVVTGSGKLRRRQRPSNRVHPKDAIEAEDGPGKKMTLKKPLEVN